MDKPELKCCKRTQRDYPLAFKLSMVELLEKGRPVGRPDQLAYRFTTCGLSLSFPMIC